MSFLTTTASNSGILPSEYAGLITKPLTEQALAFNPALTTVLHSERHDIILPSIEEDVSSEWVNEGEEIALDDPTMSETTLGFHKVAGVTAVSSEMANDSTPQAATIIGQSISRSIIANVNKAFLGGLPAPAPQGLETVTGVLSAINATATISLDTFALAVSMAEEQGHQLTGWIMNPTDAFSLTTMRESDTSQRRLLADANTIEGLPVFKHPAVPKGTAWGLDASGVYTGLREDVTLATASETYFTSDRIAIRTTARIGFAVPDPKSVVKLSLYTA